MTDVIRNLPIEEYHSSLRLSTSKMADFATGGPRLFAMRHIKRSLPPREQTDAMRFGQLFEDATQGREPDWSTYAVKPEGMSFATKDGKAWRSEHEGKQIISQLELDTLKWMTESVIESEYACSLIRASEQQVSLTDDFACQLGLQARPDWLNFRDGYSLDLKTCQTLCDITSGSSVREYRYHCQAEIVVRLACQSAELRTPTFAPYLIAVEKSAPYRCQVVEISTAWLVPARRWVNEQIDGIDKCVLSGEWPRVTEQVVQLPEPPTWL